MNPGRELFRTKRLLVRQITEADVDAMHAVYGNVDAMRWVDDGSPLDRAGCLGWVAVTERNYASRGYGMSALVLESSGDVIGFCGLVHPGGQAETEIKYALLPEHWGNGFATEAVQGMLAYGVQDFAMQRVIATISPLNLASQRVLVKAGMSHVETRHNEDGSDTEVLSWSSDGAS